MLNRRSFLQAAAASPLATSAAPPSYRVVSAHKPAAKPGMPGPFPGQVVAVHAARSVDEASESIDGAVVREMMTRGLVALTGEKRLEDAWRRFIDPADVVAIKVNPVGRPGVISSPDVVAEIVRNLIAVGVKPDRIWLYDRFKSQLDEINYPQYLPEGVHVLGAEDRRGGIQNYDARTYVECDFFGEDDTRSNIIRLLTETVTKIINVPNMKDHGASGVTGCLKNVGYGSFSNVDRSHARGGASHTLSFIGTLAATEPVRSKTVLQIMDGLKGVWHGGPFSTERRFRFYPKEMHFGTDPVAIDRLLLDIVDNKRKAEGAISIWDRSPKSIGRQRDRDRDPNVNILIREPGHVEYASKLGLGVHNLDRIRVNRIDLG
ncbi:MAG: DUF362 domain-containing protein [Bryobacteraceae bacterium]